MNSEVVTLNIQGRVARLEINRPTALNSLNEEVLTVLAKNIQLLAKDENVQVVILSGAGEKAFVAGADIKQMQSLKPDEAQLFSQLGSQVFSSLESLPQIVIAQVQGFALGGGLELALSADFIVASEKAKFGLPEVSLGLIPGFGGTQRLSRRIGVAKAIEWTVTGEKYSAQEALDSGLINRMVKFEELQDTVEKLSVQITRNGPAAVRRAKIVIRQGRESHLNVGLQLESNHFGLCFGTEESKEGMLAFTEKRAAKFND